MTTPDQPLEPEVPPVHPEVVEDGGTQRDQMAKRDDERSGYELSYREGLIIPHELGDYERIVPGFGRDYLYDILHESQHR